MTTSGVHSDRVLKFWDDEMGGDLGGGVLKSEESDATVE